MIFKKTIFLGMVSLSSLLLANDISIDADRDGVIDFKDDCISTPIGYYVDAKGCANLLILHPDFFKNGFDISADLEKEIQTLVEFMKNRPHHTMKIVGHSSRTAVSGDAYNLKLSKKRAEALKKELISRGISAEKIITVGKGFHEPIYTNETEEGRSKNRRLEIEFSEKII